MNSATTYGIVSLIPIVLVLILAFVTKDAAFALIIGCIVGVVITGFDPATGMSKLFQNALGNADFIWVLMIEVAIGILIAFYFRAGVINAFANWASNKIRSRRFASGLAWILGVLIFFSDYFSPLFSGPVARPITDKFKVSREKLSYLLDSGSAPVCTIIPISGWVAYISGLLVGHGPIKDIGQGTATFIKSIPYNFYGWFAIILAGLIGFNIIKDYGPMRRAEERAAKEGKVIRDGATPLAGEELEQIKPIEGKATNLLVYLIIPILIIVGIAISTFAILHSTKILEAFFAAVLYMAIALSIGSYIKNARDLMDLVVKGIKGVLPAIIILALAYCINTVSKTMGAQAYVISLTQRWMTGNLLPLITFITGAAISFFTGTSWGTYAILTPIALPIAFSISGGAISPVVLATIGAIVGGGAFGDHCSPVSDTTVLSSFAAGSDHIDHVTTQLPYALTAAGIAICAFIIVGFII